MSKFKATASFYADGAKHFNQGEEIDAGVYYSLTATDKGKFIQIPDPAPLAAAPAAQMQGSGPNMPGDVLGKMEADLEAGGEGKPAGEDTFVRPVADDGGMTQTTVQMAGGEQQAAADTHQQVSQVLSDHRESVRQKLDDFINKIVADAEKVLKEAEQEGAKAAEKIREFFTGKQPLQE